MVRLDFEDFDFDFDFDAKPEPLTRMSMSKKDFGVKAFQRVHKHKPKKQSQALVKAIEEVGIPEPGEQVNMMTLRAFNPWEWVRWLIKQGVTIHETLIVTYSVAYDTGIGIDDAARSGQLGPLTIVISLLRNSAYRDKEKILKDRWIENPNIHLIYAGSHAKILSLNTDRGYLTLDGSGNLSQGVRFEQYNLTNSKQLFEFHKSWIQDLEKLTTKKGIISF